MKYLFYIRDANINTLAIIAKSLNNDTNCKNILPKLPDTIIVSPGCIIGNNVLSPVFRNFSISTLRVVDQ